MKTIVRHLLAFWNSFINSFRLFRKHDTLTLGAALSYYTGFSLIPIIVIVISVLGVVVGPQLAQEEIKTQLQNLMGAKGAAELQGIIGVSYQPGSNVFVAIVAVILFMGL